MGEARYEASVRRGREIHGIGYALGQTDRMTDGKERTTRGNAQDAIGPVDGTHRLASLARMPLTSSLLVTLFGAACLGVSIALPIGIAFFGLAALGAFAVVGGGVTLVILLLGQLVGLGRRSDQVVQQGRRRILLPGTKAPQPEVEVEVAEPPSPAAEVAAVLDLRPEHSLPSRV